MYSVGQMVGVMLHAVVIVGHFKVGRQSDGGISAALKTDAASINIKATTEEGLGFTGSGEGIAAHAVCLLGKA